MMAINLKSVIQTATIKRNLLTEQLEKKNLKSVDKEDE